MPADDENLDAPGPGEGDDRPMTEAEWEAHFAESEVRSARYQDLFETLIDHPDRDAIIDREMGWDDVDGGEDEEEFEAALAAAEDPEAVAEQQRENEELERTPAYRQAFDAGVRVMESLDPFFQGHVNEAGEPIDDIGERLQEATSHAMLPATKIAGGHNLGYDDDVLCGNIVLNRKALAAAEQARDALRWLGDHGHLPPHLAGELDAEMAKAIALLDARIAELRAGVWWE